MSEQTQTPVHVAIIMDGNGRWAKHRGLERYEGHMQGVESVRSAIKAAIRNNVGYLTLYAFSTENWGRPADEVDALMDILCRSIVGETPELCKQGVRVKTIGSTRRFSDKVKTLLEKIDADTSNGDRLTLILALDYSSRSEIVEAVKHIARKATKGETTTDEITEKTVSDALYTARYPDPDLIIRTSGECRLSNFLLWQASYSELYFTDVLWPDFNEEEFDKAIKAYAARNRRFGLVK